MGINGYSVTRLAVPSAQAQEWLPPDARADWCQWQCDPAAPIFPAHQYVQEQASTTPDGPGGCLDNIQRRITLAAAIMVGREVQTLNTAIQEHLS